MKKLISTVLCLFILLSCILPAMAATGVPEEVMESTKSVVRILSKYYNGAATGSGFVIKNEPGEVLIATNDHVVEGNPTSISIWVGEDRMVDAEIVFTTSEKDLCVLKVTDTVDMKPLKLSKEEPQHGAAIYVVGYPGAGDILSDTQAHTSESVTITDGIISAIRSFTIEKGGNPVKLLQVNAAINSGNSGGPLFNTEGVVVGVNTYKVNADSQGVFGSVDISELWRLLDQYGIDIPEEPEAVEEVIEESSFLMPVLICAGVVCLVLTVILIAKRRKKNTPQRKSKDPKIQTITLQAHMEKYPQGLGVGGSVSLLLSAAIQLRNFHNDGKLHLQICPENILIGADGASLKDPSSQETGRFNSGFAAPEIYRGAGFGITSDIYSFAAVLLYAATGKVPANSLQWEALEQDFALLEDMAFAAIIRKAMTPNILDRTQSMQELIYNIAVYKAPVQEKKVQPQRTVKTVPASEREEIPVPAPVKREQAEILKHQKKTVPKKKHRKRLPIAAVLVCGIVAVVLMWKPAEKQEEIAELQSTEQAETTVPMTPEEAAYAEAENLLADGETAKAAIAFGKLGDYKDARQRSYALWDQVAVRDIIAVQGGNFWGTTHAVKEDGTAVFAGGLGGTDTKKQLSKDIRANGLDWNDLIAVSNDLTGLKADGTVVKKYHPSWFKRSRTFSEWKDIVAIDGFLGLRMDGTVVEDSGYLEDSTREEISQWKDIIAICGSGWPYFGLTVDGTIVMAGDWGEWQYDISQWQDIIAIRSGDGFLVGLRADGTVVATGKNGDRQCDVSQWTDVIAIAAGNCHTVGLKSDGTVLTTGSNRDGACNVEKWTDIIAVFAGGFHTVGLKSDGTVVAAGSNTYGQCNVREWSGISLPGQLVSKPKEAPTDQQAQYDAAEKLLADGETAKAAIAFGKLGDYKDARERSFAAWNKVPNRKTISFDMWNQGPENIVMFHALRKDGTIAVDCRYSETLSDEEIAQYMPSTYKNIVSIHGTIGLRYDGTLSLPGSDFHYYQELMEWSDLVAISVPCNPYDEFFVGLKSDGTVVAVGNNKYGECNVTEWKDIIAIAAGEDCTFGLKSDGTVVATGRNLHGMCEVESWTDIKAISTHDVQTFGLRNDGTVVAIGSNYNGAITRASKLTNIAFIEGMYAFKEDGTSDSFSEEKWNNIVSITYSTEMGGMDIIGLRYDGSFVFSRGNDNSYVRAKAWNDIQLPIISETPITMPVDNASAY